MERAVQVSQAGCSEQELVAAVRRGDDAAFAELFSRYRPRISSYIRGMVGDWGRTEDITQEVFISALRRLRGTERPIAFKPWIYEIARNGCIDEHRRTRRVREVPLEPDEDAPGKIDLRSQDPTPEAAVESKQRLDDLRGAFHGLSENHHRILVLRELEGLSYGEIGKRLGMSRTVVESTLFRARRRLSEEYRELISGRRCERMRAVIDSGKADLIRSFGSRERRQIARHLAHCQLCRRHARAAGLDDSLLTPPRRGAARIAGLLPFPWLRWRWRRGPSQPAARAQPGSHSFAATQSMQSLGQLADRLLPSLDLGRAAAAAAALAIAGAGGGVVSGLATNGGGQAHDGRLVSTKVPDRGGPVRHGPVMAASPGGPVTVAAPKSGPPAGGGSAAQGSQPGPRNGSASQAPAASGAGSSGSGSGSGSGGSSGGGSGGGSSGSGGVGGLPIPGGSPVSRLPSLSNNSRTPSVPRVSLPVKPPTVSAPSPGNLVKTAGRVLKGAGLGGG